MWWSVFNNVNCFVYESFTTCSILLNTRSILWRLYLPLEWFSPFILNFIYHFCFKIDYCLQILYYYHHSYLNWVHFVKPLFFRLVFYLRILPSSFFLKFKAYCFPSVYLPFFLLFVLEQISFNLVLVVFSY